MATKGQVGIKGLVTSGNRLALGPGTLIEASNCAIPSKDMLMPARGSMQQSEYASSSNGYIDGDNTDANSNRPTEVYQWGTALYVNYTGNAGYKLASFATFGTSPSRALVGSYAPPEPTVTRMKFATLAKSLYWTTDAGLCTVDAVGGTARAAGIRAPEGVVPATGGGLYGNPNASGSWLPTNSSVGIRARIGFKDANGVIHLSAACGRLVVVNPKDLTVAIGSLVRNANVVTATVTSHTFQIGDILNLTLTGADIGNFNPTNNTVTAVTSTTVVWAETAANYTNVASVTVTSGLKYLVYAIILPPSMTTSHFIQVYRTDEVTGETVDPGDEMFLAYERYLTSSDISARFATVTDRTPSGRLGAPLDSNTNSGEGSYGQNYRPPLARDICAWDGRLWALQTTDPHKIRIRLLGTGTPDGLQANDVLCLGTYAMQFTAPGGSAPNVYTEFTPSQNVRRTLSSLINGLNYALNSTTYVLRLLMDGDDNETWGAFSFEEDGVGGAAFYAGTTRTTAFAEPLATAVDVTEASSSRAANVVTITTGSAHGFSTGDTIVLAANALTGEANFPVGIKTPITVTGASTFTYAETGSNATMSGTPAYWVYKATFKSDNNQQPARFSREGIPEAWPLVNTLGGLPDGAEVLRGVPSGSGYSLLLFLKDGAIYRVSGEYPYTVRRLDDTVSLLCADSLVAHSGKLHAFTTQGLATITESGVSIIGADVEDTTQALALAIGAQSLNGSLPFSVSYESARQFRFFCPTITSGDASTTVQQSLDWQSLYQGYTRQLAASFKCGLVFRGRDFLVTGDGSSNQLRIERKYSDTVTFKSFAAERLGVRTLSSSPNSTTVILSSAVTGLAAGDAVYNATIGGSSPYALITAVNGATLTVVSTVQVGGWSPTDELWLYKRQTVTVTLAPDAGGAPGIEKRWREVQFHFGRYLAHALTVTFANERGATGTVTVTDSSYVAATPNTGVRLVRVAVPSAVQMCSTLTVTLTLAEAFSFFELFGASATAETVSERSGK